MISFLGSLTSCLIIASAILIGGIVGLVSIALELLLEILHIL